MAAIHHWAEANGVPIRSFAKGENKEKASAWRWWKGERARERGASAHGVGPPDGFDQPLLLLPVGSRVGSSLLEDQPLCPVPNLAVAEWPLLGARPAGQGPHRFTKHWTTASAGAPTRPPSSASATDWAPVTCTPSSGAGSTDCRRRSPPTTSRQATPMSWPSASSRSPTPACSIAPRLGVPSSRVSSATTWTWSGRPRSWSSSTAS